MEITGKIIAILPQSTGQGKNGMWRSQDYVLETGDQYPKKVCFNLFNDKIDQFPLAIDELVTVSFDIESREYNGDGIQLYVRGKLIKTEHKLHQALSRLCRLLHLTELHRLAKVVICLFNEVFF